MNKPKRAPQPPVDLRFKPFGAALLCSPDAVVTRVVYDSHGMFRQTGTGAVPIRPAAEIATGQSELVQRNIALENINKEKTRWLLTATHDLRNQLYAVRSYAELLSEEPADCLGLEQKKILEYLYGSVESMLHLLSDLTEIASTEDGNARLHISSTALLPLFDTCISICRPIAARKDITLRRVWREPPPAINIDAERIQHVLVELIENAVKYSPTGAKVELDAVRNGSVLLISVRDNGPGIPVDELESIFTPLQKTRARAACMEPGTGLGLAICKRMVEQHEGRIWAESILGEGTTLHVVLPYNPCP
jgi:signal transduction histidine kinase